MRQIIRRTIFLLTSFGVAALLLLAPAASAQSTQTTELLDTGETLVTTTLITASQTIVTETVTSADGCTQDITTTTTTLVTDADPVVPTDEYETRTGTESVVRPSQIVTVTTAQNLLPCDEDEVLGITVEPDEVLGEVVLATTGSNIDMPLAVGAGLIGMGGLLVVASKRRRSSADD